jgi:hypothetical protein
MRPDSISHEAAAKYLNDFALKSTVRRDAAALKDLEPYIGHLWLDQINNDSFNAYRNARQDLTIITRNGKIGGARRIRKLAAEVWCYPNTNMTWLERAPTILAEKGHRPRRSRVGARQPSQKAGVLGSLGLLPQNSLANFTCVRGRWWKSLVGADGLEPPTFAL